MDAEKHLYIKYKNCLILAKRRGLEFKLSYDEYRYIVLSPCYYCDISGDYIVFNGIDRVNNNIGYIKDNCVSCCTVCNSMKSDRNITQFYKQVYKIYHNRVKTLKCNSIDAT